MEEHISVLLNEVVEAFSPVMLHRYVDGTVGAGGHAKAVAATHPELKLVVGIDQDPTALELAEKALQDTPHQLVRGNFEELESHLNELQIDTVDGILVDLGVSSMQLDRKERGFSFSKEGPLDMRMDPSGPLTAQEVVNHWPEAKLAEIFHYYGEMIGSRRIAKALVERRKDKMIETTTALVELLDDQLPKGKKTHPATLLFQALRIAVNDEMGVLERFLPQAIDRLAPGGRLAVITFHSLEDRIVKRAFREAAQNWIADPTDPYSGRRPIDAKIKIVTGKPVVPSKEEIRHNPRSRSAKLRVVERL